VQTDGMNSADDRMSSPAVRAGRISLRFADPALEQRFTDEHLRRSLPIIRLSLFFAALLYAVFGILDSYIVPDVLYEVWFIRYGVVCPIVLGIVLFTFSHYFFQFAQLAVGTVMVVTGLGIIAMTAVANPPGNYLYYAGLIMVVIYGSSLVRLRYLYAAAISVFLLAAYQLVALYINPIPVWALTSNDFFLAMSTAVGVFSSYAQEYFVRQSFANTHLLVQEKARSEELLEKANAANHAKGEFLAVMSHELRTPLNAIIGFSEVLKAQLFGPLGSERYRSYAEDIFNSGNHLLAIISDILDISKAEAGKLTINSESLDGFEILDDCLRMFREKAAERGIRLAAEEPPERIWLDADPRLLRQVLINLISNAIKFTQRGGSILVSTGCDDLGRCYFRVVDSGVGIASSDLPKVLEPFVQIESAYTREHEGTGLGLPLVKKVMDLHGGTLDIESELGVGTTLTVWFPSERVKAVGTFDEAATGSASGAA